MHGLILSTFFYNSGGLKLGWGGKDFRWGSKVRCNSAAKNHPSAPPLETVNNTYVTFIIVKVSSSPLKQILFIPDVGKIHNNTAHVSPEKKNRKRKNEREKILEKCHSI